MDDLDELKSPFRSRGVRILVTALAVNALLALLLVGGPWLRGRLRAQEARRNFAEFAACLWGGHAAARPGLGLPEGEEVRYAHRVLHGDEDWPQRCRPRLRGVAREPAWMLFPAIKQAEKVVAEAVTHADEGLLALAEERVSGPMRRVPLELHRRVERLLATLSHLATESGTAGQLTAPAFHFGDEPLPLVAPTRIPLKVSRRVPPRMWAHGDGLVAFAMDRRTIAYAKVGAGGMSLQRVRRPSLVQGTVAGPAGHPWLVWAMPERRCAEDATSCAGHALGVAQLERHHARAPEPLWLAAHPHGDVEGAVRVHADPRSPGAPWVDVIARRLEGGAEVRRFGVASAADDGDAGPDAGQGAEDPADPVRPRSPEAVWTLPDHGRAGATRWVQGVEPAVHVAAKAEGVSLWVRPLGDDGSPPAPVATVSMGDQGEPPWLRACPHPGGAWVFYGRGPDAALARVARAGEARPVNGTLNLGSHEGIALACDEARLTVVRADPDAETIAWWSCGSHRCEALPPTTARAHHLQAIREGDATVVAFAEGSRTQVQVAVWNADAPGPSAPRALAPCYGRDGGHCGPPVLAARNGRILVGARDGPDLLVVETVDGGRSWMPMRGLK